MIAAALGGELSRSRPVGGGCVHDARQLELSGGTRVFVKSGRGAAAQWLASEAMGLELLAQRIRTPELLGCGELPGGARWLAMEWLEMTPFDKVSWEDLGRQLAALHGVGSDRCGLDHDNFIGGTPQSNGWMDGWTGFFIERRLRPQLELARKNGHAVPERDALRLAESALAGHEPAASLLHGDLWSGNAAGLSDGRAVVFDPAPYHGDAETDLAMLELFAGPLPAAFFRGYGQVDPSRETRRPVYDLYHALNHLNLFGSGYAGMVRRCLLDG
ncbi:MAG: fructosamine kinase family protein [Verrucomicrobia bacterium]|nr:fructosamine kinase family protein [Verrucomicrobiota bacterium]